VKDTLRTSGRSAGRRRAADAVDRLTEALEAARYSYCSGGTHNFYHYPARFSPDIARAAIELFSGVDDIVLDPFMGGGTAIIEGLALGRRMVGIDLNALAHFVTAVRTTVLSPSDEEALITWSHVVAERFGGKLAEQVDRERVKNLPEAVELFLSGALRLSDGLRFPRQRAFARCVLLRLGQWALDCRDFVSPRRRMLADRLPRLVGEMLAGLQGFVDECGAVGISKNVISGRRVLLHRSAVGMEDAPGIMSLAGKPKLVMTSPPYPSVHVLYHRWQYRGRKETPAPYWIARVPDGFYESYYTGGSRTPLGRERYFAMITNAFRSVRKVLDDNGLVVQLVGFSDTGSQLPRYLEAMDAAGFEEWTPGNVELDRLQRRVPNRKWYAKLQASHEAAQELLLFHRPRRPR